MSTFRTSLRIVAAHRVIILVYLLTLSMFGLLMGLSVTDTADEVVDTHATVAVVDRDGSEVSRGVTRYLGSVGEARPLKDSRQALQDATAQNRISYILIIPAGYGQSLQASARQGGKPPALETVVNYESAAGSLMDVRTTSYLEQVRTYLGAVTDDPARAVALADAAMEHTTSAELVPQEATPLPRSLLVYAQFSLSPLTAFAIVAVSTLMTSLGRRAVRSRLSAAPVSGWERGRGLMGSCLVVGLAGWAWILCLGVAVFGRGYLASAAPLLGVVAAALGAYTLVPVSLGFLLGQLGLKENAANVIANIGGLAMSFLGGAWISTDLMPAALVTVARFTPTYWANRAMTGASEVRSVSADTVLPLLTNCGVCALFAVAIFSVGLAVGRTRARSSL